ncbi:hypothetical protein M514_11417 [Trichuris suis]|uniref:Helix-turn-helix domain-containing protein n=1 Tax=Trichuris suis TaxID=68888 RepID=A0A085LRZ3_9BILA|nr:hypothetical protein M513_11417 [Trichuris suis]KFD60829.1 hypothetical protein M514_11417 [Trichuris suis]
MIDRAISICDKEFLAAELAHVKATFLYNGYPPGLVSSVVRQRTNRPEVPLPDHNVPLLLLPYYKGAGEKIRQMGHPRKIMEEAVSSSAVVEHVVACLHPDDQVTVTRMHHDPEDDPDGTR